MFVIMMTELEAVEAVRDIRCLIMLTDNLIKLI